MSWIVVFVVMIIIVCLLLLAASIASSISANDSFNSTFYNTDPRIRSAYQYLIIASGLGWATLIVLILLVIIAAVAGGFSTIEVSDDLLSNCNPTKADLLAAYAGEKSLSSGYTTQIIVLIILIILALVILTMAILTVIAAVQLGDMKQKDNNANNAYITSSIAAGINSVNVILMIIAIIAYINIGYARSDRLIQIKEFEKRAELQLGVKPEVYTMLPTTTTTLVSL